MEKFRLSPKIILCVLLFMGVLLVTKEKVSEAASYIWPVGGNNSTETYIDYGYGARNYDSTAYDKKYNYAPYEQSYSAKENHYGVDIAGVKGHTYSVVSVSSGTVIATSANRYYNAGINFVDRNKRKSTSDGGGYGNYIIIQEASTGKCFVYAHLKAGTLKVSKGSKVTAGQVIATMGSSGDSGHQHLHFEVRKNLASTTTNNGGSLVTTTGYNVQTENPLNYVTAPTKAKLNNVTSSSTSTSTSIYLNFNKSVKVNKTPVLTVTVGSETKKLSTATLSQDGKKLTYTLNYDSLAIHASGTINVSCTDTGDVVDKSATAVTVNCKFSTKNLGTLSALKITSTYIPNDINGDGEINATDANIVLNLTSKKAIGKTLTATEQAQYAKADANRDGKVDSTDATFILKYYANIMVGKSESYKKLSACDFTGDHKVDISDYNALSAAINKGTYVKTYDLNNDKAVNSKDMDVYKSVVKDLGTR